MKFFPTSNLLVVALLSTTALAQYSVSSTPGTTVIPSGAPGNTGGGGAWPGTFPPALATQTLTLAAPIPAGATNIKRVILQDLYHTWAGDLQIVLNAPGGTPRYNLVHRIGYPAGAAGHSVNFGVSGTTGADYTIVDPADPQTQVWPGTNPGSTSYLPAGVYAQEHGIPWGPGWTDGTNGVETDTMSSIPATSGIWTLTIYDWAGADVGTISHFTIEGDSGPSLPTVYCTAGTSTNGCVPSISANAQPNAALTGSCVVTITNVEGAKSGIVFYGLNNSGFTPSIWAVGSNSFLCAKAPVQRMNALNSGGTASLCNGVLTQNMYTFFVANPGALGLPLSVGNKLYVQGWYRDPPAPKTTNLTNALEMTVQ